MGRLSDRDEFSPLQLNPSRSPPRQPLLRSSACGFPAARGTTGGGSIGFVGISLGLLLVFYISRWCRSTVLSFKIAHLLFRVWGCRVILSCFLFFFFFVSIQIVAAIFAIAGIVMMTYADGFHSHSVIGIALVVGSASMSALYKVSTPGPSPTPRKIQESSPSSLCACLANCHAVQCHMPIFEGSAMNTLTLQRCIQVCTCLESALT